MLNKWLDVLFLFFRSKLQSLIFFNFEINLEKEIPKKISDNK